MQPGWQMQICPCGSQCLGSSLHRMMALPLTMTIRACHLLYLIGGQPASAQEGASILKSMCSAPCRHTNGTRLKHGALDSN